MRPILLTFGGLRSYRAPVEIDFTDLDLFAVIGDTGAGKSTIIEALSLALYARKTWTGGAGIEDMIADGERLFRVELTFAAADHEWRVTRSRSRGTGAGVNKLICLTAAERVDGSVAVTERVTQLIGLDHGQFTRAVVMPQGRFDELLRATPSERGKLLGSILGLDDVRAVGRAADALAGRWREPLVAARTRRAGLPVDPAAALAAAEVEVARAASRLTALQAAIDRAAAAEGLAASVRVALDRLAAAQAALPAGDGADAVATLRAAHAAGVALHRERDEAVAARDLAAAEVAAVDERATAALAGFAGRDAAVVAGGALRRSAADLAEATAMGDETQDRLAALDASPPAAAVPAVLVTGRDAAAADRDRARAADAAATAAVAVARSAWTELAVAHRRAAAAA
ncbi:MAG: SMC family ATPase, partial [Acidimicrobiales bacterium]